MRKIREIFLYRPHYRRCIKTSFFARLYWLCFHFSFFSLSIFFFFPFWCIAIVCLSFMFCILLLFMLFFLFNSFVCFENLKILLRFFFAVENCVCLKQSHCQCFFASLIVLLCTFLAIFATVWTLGQIEVYVIAHFEWTQVFSEDSIEIHVFNTMIILNLNFK